MSDTTIILLRHGLTDWNQSGRFQGQYDLPLNDMGRAQAAEVVPHIAALAPDVIYSSPLSRARDTAAVVAEPLSLGVWADDRLMEIDVGSWVGHTIADMVEADPEFAVAMAEGRDFRRSPTGETAHEVGVRMAACLHELGERHEGQRVLVVTHGLAGRMGIGYSLGWDYATTWGLGALWNCGWSLLRHRGRWRLEAYNRVVGHPVDLPHANERLDFTSLGRVR